MVSIHAGVGVRALRAVVELRLRVRAVPALVLLPRHRVPPVAAGVGAWHGVRRAVRVLGRVVASLPQHRVQRAQHVKRIRRVEHVLREQHVPHEQRSSFPK